MAQHMIKTIERKGNSYRVTFQDDLNTETVYTYSPEELGKFAALLHRAQKLSKDEEVTEENPGVLDFFKESKDYTDERIIELITAIDTRLAKFNKISEDACINMQVNTAGVERAHRFNAEMQLRIEELTEDLKDIYKERMEQIRKSYIWLETTLEDLSLKSQFDGCATEGRLQECEERMVESLVNVATLEASLRNNDLAYHQAGLRIAEAEKEILRLQLERAQLESSIDDRIQKLERRGIKAWFKRVFGSK